MLITLVSVFVASIIVANIIAFKVWAVGPFVFPAAIIAYPITFLCTDILGEVFGRKSSHTAVWAGFGANILMLVLVYIGGKLPAAPFWHNQQAYETVFSNTWRVVAGSMAAYLLAQHHDVWAFHFWKRVTSGRRLWQRNILSTGVSQIIDTVVFITTAFAFVVPWHALLMMMASQYAFKFGFALLDTPFCYLGVYMARRVKPAEMLS